ncbi:fructose-bisphosphate aldolase class I [Candidatus Microgenomates bacterium]|nr:fructose-bisphosphate aldolase class I [Candidatus Microgenomates bacterium]
MSSKKGVLALDWSPSTIEIQFKNVGITSTPQLNRVYRQMLVTTPELNEFISGIILHDETVNQQLDSGEGFVEYLGGLGIVSGVRADDGKSKYGDTQQDMTEGLDSLDDRLKKYAEVGIKFTKWRAAFKISDYYPSKEFLKESIDRLVTFAKISHKHGLVPFVEPDVEMKGDHTTTRCSEVTAQVLKLLFDALKEAGVDLENVILKTNMVLPGTESGVEAASLEVANATLYALRKSVPENVGGIVFLSGGQSYEDSVHHLDKIEDLARNDPWEISFSYARALQKDALEVWSGKEENIDEAQKVLIERIKKVVKARKGEL